jgi:lipopolysaccharide/colanic/teichoic acid biosynthesis glycosyltransferase
VPDAPLVTLVVGVKAEVAAVMQHASAGGLSPLQVVGAVLFPDAPADDTPDDPAQLPESDIREAARQAHAAALLVAGAPGHRTMAALGELAITLGCRLLVLAPASIAGRLAPAVVTLRGVPIIEMVPPRPSQLVWAVKRAVDMALAASALVVTAPLLALLAAAIRVGSPGHPFFGHERVGMGGRRFRCWKLRTMHVNAEQRLVHEPALRAAYEANDFKLPEALDPRITRLGRWLRRTSLDELPQLWNVLVGEMSLVGPRPVVTDELAHYRGTVLELLSVRPGLTGAWAVSGRHGVAYPERAAIELQYVRTRTLLGDLRIALVTVKAVLHPGGA